MAVTEHLPVAPQDITAEWLGSKLGLNKATVTVNEIVRGTASKILVTITPLGDDSTNKQPQQLCVKGGFNPEMLDKYPFILSMFAREVDFFQLVAPKVPQLSLPQMLWAGKTADNAVIVMEDLAAAGFIFADPVETWPVDRVRLVVEQFAALHAATWGMSRKDAPWLDDHYESAMLGLASMWDDIVLAVDRPPSVPEYMKNKERMTAAIKTWFVTQNPKFRCLQHGDAHLGNLGWSEERGVPVVLDWQLINLGSCFIDLAYFIMAALTVEDRRAHELALLDHYLAKLKDFGGPQLGRNDPEVIDEYGKSFMAGFSWVFCPYTMQAKERVWAVVSRLIPAMEDHKTVELLERK